MLPRIAPTAAEPTKSTPAEAIGNVSAPAAPANAATADAIKPATNSGAARWRRRNSRGWRRNTPSFHLPYWKYWRANAAKVVRGL